MNWENEWNNVMSPINEVSTVSYWNKRAEDYNNFIRTSRFSYGEEIVGILKGDGFLTKSMKVLEIAGGVGALTLPLCRQVKSVTTVEPAENMVAKLRQNAEEQQIENMTVIMGTCQEVAEYGNIVKHDISIMCHASWQFPDLRWLVRFMEEFGSGKVCIADSIPGNDSEKDTFYKQLGVKDNSFDRFHTLLNVLHYFNRDPEIQLFPFTIRRSSESAMAMATQVVSKYRQPDPHDLAKIEDFVSKHTHSGIYTEKALMGVLWWENSPSLQ